MKGRFAPWGETAAACTAVFLLSMGVSLAAERKLADFPPFTALAPAGFACAPEVTVTVRAPDESAFTSKRVELQKLIGGLRAILGFECPKTSITNLVVVGEAGGKEVYQGSASESANWLLRDIGVPPAASAPNVAQPSFDCRKARSWSELEVCRDETLANLDVTLASLYRNQKAQLTGTQNEALIVDQRRWLADRDKCKFSDLTAKCLIDIYKNRISELSSIEVGSRNQPAAIREPERPSTTTAKMAPIMQVNATKISGVVFAVIVLVAIFAYSRHKVEQRFVHQYPSGRRLYRHWMDVCTLQAHNHPDRACLITGFLAISVLFVGLSIAFSGVAEAQAYGAAGAVMGAVLIASVVYAWKDTDGFAPEQWKRDANDWPTNHWVARSVGPWFLAAVIFCCTWYIVLVWWMASAIMFFVRRV